MTWEVTLKSKDQKSQRERREVMEVMSSCGCTEEALGTIEKANSLKTFPTLLPMEDKVNVFFSP